MSQSVDGMPPSVDVVHATPIRAHMTGLAMPTCNGHITHLYRSYRPSVTGLVPILCESITERGPVMDGGGAGGP